MLISFNNDTIEINGNTFINKADMTEDQFVETLEAIGFNSNLIQYSFDSGLKWHQKYIDYIYNVLNEYRNSAYYSKDAIHLQNSSARQFSTSVLKIGTHNDIIIKPVE